MVVLRREESGLLQNQILPMYKYQISEWEFDTQKTLLNKEDKVDGERGVWPGSEWDLTSSPNPNFRFRVHCAVSRMHQVVLVHDGGEDERKTDSDLSLLLHGRRSPSLPHITDQDDDPHNLLLLPSFSSSHSPSVRLWLPIDCIYLTDAYYTTQPSWLSNPWE